MGVKVVNARLHIICGNCGQDLKEPGMATWEYIPREDFGEGEFNPSDVFIHCDNCATLHSLIRYIPKRQKPQSDDLTLGEKLYCTIQDVEDYIQHNNLEQDEKLDQILQQLEEIKEVYDNG